MKPLHFITSLFILLLTFSFFSLSAQQWTFASDWQAGRFDNNGSWMGGTELLNIRTHKGQLFATTGYWNDQPGDDPASGPHILVKKESNADWEVETTFDATFDGNRPRHLLIVALESIVFTKDSSGNNLPNPDTLLIAGVYDALGLGISVRNDDTKTYSNAVIRVGSPSNGNVYNIIRSIQKYTHPITGGEFLYIGSWSAVYKGWYDSNAPSKIKFNAQPAFSFPTSNTWVASMTVANGKLYAGCGPEANNVGGIWEKEDTSDDFTLIHRLPYPGSVSVSNPRGLTAIPDPKGGNHEVLLFAFEGNGDIIRLDPYNNYKATIEINVRDYFDALPNTFTTNVAAYNDIIPFRGRHLIGVAMTNATPAGAADTKAPRNGTYFLTRNVDASYTHQYVYDTANPVEEGLNLRAVRTICISPFNDETSTIYLGGFDGAGGPHHNTAWLYKGVLANRIDREPSENLTPYPNPAEHALYIHNAEKEIVDIVMYTLDGQVVRQESFPPRKTIHIAGLLPGTYFVKITFKNGEVIVKRVVKK
ncbi:MAG: T9SS type A sorting domain-containing protein [Thermonemataceae bacterium]